MKSRSVFVAISAALVVGFFFGRVGFGGGGSSMATTVGGTPVDAPMRTRAAIRPSSTGMTPHARFLTEINRSSSSEVSSRVFQALETGDPVLRKQLVASLLAKMDSDNFQEMLDEVERVSNETGREHTDEWILMNIRAGQVAGATAMRVWEKRDLASSASLKTFFGWATADPVAAREWMEHHPDLDSNRKARFLKALLSGAVVNDPEVAKKSFASLPEEARLDCLRDFSSSLVDNIGKEGMIDWLVSLQSADKDSSYTGKVATRVFDRMMWSGANRLNAKSMVSDMERLSTLIPIDEAWIVRGMGQIRERKDIGGIELLDQIAQSPVFKDQSLTDYAWNNAVDFAIRRNRKAVGTWLRNNPDSPIHQRVADSYGQNVD